MSASASPTTLCATLMGRPALWDSALGLSADKSEAKYKFLANRASRRAGRTAGKTVIG